MNKNIPCLLCLALLPLSTARAQFIHFRAGQDRVTVPLNSTVTTVVTNQVKLTGVNSSGATLSILGLPAGAGATIDVNPATSNNTPINITINTANISQGEYTFYLSGTGLDTNSLPLSNVWTYVLQAGHIWNGTTNAGVDGASSWTDGSKWLGGVPGAGDDVFITDLGGQTNNTFTVPSVSTNPLVSITLSGDTTIGSLRFGPTTNQTRFHSIQINPGNTLTLTGSKGFRFLRDYISEFQGLAAAPVLTLLGGGNLVITNPAAEFDLLIDNQLQMTNDMVGLANFSATVNRFALGDYTAWPNFFNYNDDNAVGGIPRRFLPNVYFAQTNVLKAFFVDPFNYTNADNRRFGFSYCNSEIAGTTTQPMLNLGISNIFLMDSVNFVGGNQQGNVRFNPIYSNSAPIAIFRSTNGGRMSVFSVADAGGTNGENTNVKTPVGVDFASFGGTLDVLADRFYIGRDRKLIVGGQNPNYQGFVFMSRGTIDVNTMTLGFQEYSGQTNAVMFNGYCEGRLMVTNLGVGTNRILVRNNLTLGYGTQTDPNGTGSGSNTTWGQIILSGSNTTMMVSNVLIGEPVHTSRNNSIEVNSNATFVVSNSIGSSVQSLDNLTYRDSILALNLDLTRTTAYVFTTNLTTAGSNTIQIASIKNLGSLSGPVKLIQFSAGNGSFQGLIMPPGLGGALLTTNNFGIFLTILTNTPKIVIWRGYSSSAWDLTTKNWLDPLTGLHTNFSNGDFAQFDDDVSTPKTVHLAGPVDIIPGGVTMTNNSATYVIDSAFAGDIQGSATLSKWGSQPLEVDGLTSLSLQLNQGSLIGGNLGGGTLGSVTLAAGTTMDYDGNVLGGINCAGVATLEGDSSSSGTLNIQATGIVTNNGTYTGPILTSAGAFLVNNGLWQNGGNSTIVSNAMLINNGNFHALTLTIGGTLKDMGTGTIYMNGDVVNGTRGLTINNGATFILGGDGIGITTVAPEPNSVNNFPGRVLFSSGSTNIFKVNPVTPTNTVLKCLYMGFGPNQSSQAYNGGTVVMNNVTLSAFTPGQTFKLIRSFDPSQTFTTDAFTASTNTANSYPIMSPSTPGSGMAWDLSGLLPPDGGSAGETLAGVIGVRGVATTPTNLTFNLAFGVITGTNNIGTNVFISQLSWPSNYTGWQLQEQSSSIGISTNWTTLVGATFTNYFEITNVFTTNGPNSVFFRMVFPGQ